MIYTRLIIVLAALLLTSLSYSAGSVDSKKYQTLDQPITLPDINMDNTVIEFFSFGCPHCYHFNEKLLNWKHNHTDYQLIQMPITFNRMQWTVLAKAYYIAQVTGKLDQMETKIFEAIHNQHKNLTTKANMQAFFAQNGISKEDFNKIYEHSDKLEQILKRNNDLFKQAGARGVPALVVKGKYLVAPEKGLGFKDMLNVTDQLLEQETTQQ